MCEESSHIIAKEAGCGPSTIYRWLRKMNIPVRNSSEGIFLATRNSVIITPDLLRFMGGEIIGDGSVTMHGNRSARYRHTSKYREYLIWLSECLDKWGIGQVGRITRRKDKYGIITYKYQSRSYPELVAVYKRWYPEGKKIVPQDLELPPIMARQWYLGDGGLSNYKRKHPGIVFGTYDFDRQSIGYLIEELGRLNFKATYQPSHNTIYIWAHSVKDFLEWIGPCPVSCYDYKWRI